MMAVAVEAIVYVGRVFLFGSFCVLFRRKADFGLLTESPDSLIFGINVTQ
jgi:hypothetical protein